MVGYICVTGCGSGSEVDVTLILRWDGHRLSRIASPSPGRSAKLASVTTGPHGTPYAAGYYCVFGCGSTSEIDRTLLLSWKHGTWSRIPSESPGRSARLTSASAGPTGVPWAVGYYCEAGCANMMSAEHTLICAQAARAGRASPAQVLVAVPSSTDSEYHAKYDRYGPSIVGHVTGPAAHAVTIRSIKAVQ
jgi:hypothetical protein